MFNLLMSYNPETWDGQPYQCDKTRFCEYTEKVIKDRFSDLSFEELEKLKSFPTLFAIEAEERPSRIGYIRNIRVRSNHLLVEYEFDPILAPIPKGALDHLSASLDIGKWEINRTHWAIKDADLLPTLVKHGYVTQEQYEASSKLQSEKSSDVRKNTADVVNHDHVFIVHGHDEDVKNEVSGFISSLGLKPIILHEQASKGKTIIEKIEEYTNVGFAVVLYTPCDVGSKYTPSNPPELLNYRARQNVVLEHGYLMAKLGRPRVTALVKGMVETPNDISGVVYIDYDNSNNWKNYLENEIRSANINFDPSRSFRRPL